MPPADLVWELGLGSVKLAGDSLPMNADAGATVTIKSPQVRVRSKLRWTYQLIGRDGKKLLESGELPISDFPADLTEDWPKRIQSRARGGNEVKALVVWDDLDGLPRILKAAKVPFTRVNDLTKVLDRPDMILVGPSQIDDSPFSQGPLCGFAAAGTSVAVFEQKPGTIGRVCTGPPRPAGGHSFQAGAPAVRAAVERRPSQLGGRPLRGIAGGAASTGRTGVGAGVVAGRAPGDVPRPIDALIVTRTTGAGRIVLCQVPLGPWDADPRSQILLGNLLSYLSTPPPAHSAARQAAYRAAGVTAENPDNHPAGRQPVAPI